MLISKEEELYYLCSKSKGTCQQRSYCAADLCFCCRICKPGDQWSCKRSPDIWAMYKHKTYKTWKKQGQGMTLTFNIHLLSFTELVFYIYKFSCHWLQYFRKYLLFSHFPIEKPKLPILTLRQNGSSSLQDHHLNKL